MKKATKKELVDLFNSEEFIGASARKTELGYNTKRFPVSDAIKAISWLEQSDKCSIEVLTSDDAHHEYKLLT